MDYFSAFLTVAVVHFLGMASPGPDFAITLKNSLFHGRRAGIFTGIGIGCALFVHVAYCMLGIGVVISQSILLFNIFKYVAAAYLIYVGWQAIKARPTKVEVEKASKVDNSMSNAVAFRQGFITNVLNPKVTLFFLSLFTVVISPETPLIIQFGYGVYMAVVSALWFSALACLFSQKALRQKLQGVQHWFERIMGGILIALGIKIALTSHR